MISVERARELVVEAGNRFEALRDKIKWENAFHAHREDFSTEDKRIIDEAYKKYEDERDRIWASAGLPDGE